MRSCSLTTLYHNENWENVNKRLDDWMPKKWTRIMKPSLKEARKIIDIICVVGCGGVVQLGILVPGYP